MSDIALTWIPEAYAADFVVAANDLKTDAGFETAVLISLFTDRAAEPGDVLPAGETRRRGWWGDAFPVVAGDKTGSRLWLLDRAPESEDHALRAEEYVREALQWLLDDKVAEAIDVAVTFPARGVRSIAVAIHRPTGDSVEFRYNYNWRAQAGEV